MGKEIKKLNSGEIKKVSGGNLDSEIIEYDVPCTRCGKTFSVIDSFGLPPSIIMMTNSLCPDCKGKIRSK